MINCFVCPFSTSSKGHVKNNLNFEQRVLAKPVRRPGIAHGAVVAIVTAFAVVETQFSTGNLEVVVVTAGSYLYRAEVVTVEDDSAKTRRRLVFT